MARRPLMAGNWKMNKTVAEALALVSQLKSALLPVTDREVLVCPPFTALPAVAGILRGSGVMWGGQNMSEQASGAYTGEISAAMLKDVGCTHVILGHSERRSLYGETDVLVNKKTRVALDQGLVPVVCVGETLQEREASRTWDVLKTQLRGSLGGVDPQKVATLVVAYEPVWAIGTGKTASPQQAQEAHAFLRQEAKALYGPAWAEGLRILYGGSVKPDNIDDLMRQADIDGALVGGASLKAEDFIRIARFQRAGS